MNSYPGVIVITGANGGVGSHLAGYFLEHGITNILCHYKSAHDHLDVLLSQYGLDPKKHSFCANLTNEDEVEKFRDHAVSHFSKIWAVINLAGGSSNAMSWKMTQTDFQNIMDINLLTTFLTCRAFIPHLRENGNGRIITITSVLGFTGVVGAAHYCAAKAAVMGYTKALAQELAPKKVTVNAIALGYFEYGLIHDVPPPMLDEIKSRIPLKRLGNIQEIAGMMEFLLSEKGAYTTGQVLQINGGLNG